MTFKNRPAKEAQHRFIPCCAAIVSLLAVLSASFDARAVVLGEIRSSSRLGELLHAQIEIVEEPADRFDASCVSLYRPAQAGADLPWITAAQLSFRRENGKGRLSIDSEQPLADPVVQIGIQASCPGGRVWRDYTYAVSPPAASAQAASVPTQNVSPQRRMKAAAGQPAVGENVALQPATAGAEIDRTLDADGQSPLRMSAALLAAGSSSDFERGLLRAEYRLLAALHEQAESELTLAETLRRMERGVAELRAAGLRSVPAEASAATLSAPAGPVAAPEVADSDAWFFYCGLAAALSLLLVLLMRRRRPQRVIDASLPMHAPTVVVEHPAHLPRPPARPAASREVLPVMELAEVMLSFGRVNGATEALLECIEANPRVALQPWLRLLEIYRGNGMRAEFESLATNLNQTFNVEVVAWNDAVPNERVEMSLELVPHVRDQIDALWGKPECFEYLQKLLHDNRDGQRIGFTLPVVKEILLLIELMVAEKAAADKEMTNS